VTPLSTLRVTIAIVGILIFMWGARTQDEIVRWVGIAFLVVALVLRFLSRVRRR
jgi:Ca2+/Na+ antiporter